MLGKILRQFVEYLANLRLADALHEVCEAFVLLPHPQIKICEALDSVGDSLGGDCYDRQPVRTGVLFPLPADDNLKVWNLVTVDGTADTVETDIANVVLSATIEATADLNVQILDRLVHLKALLGQTGSQLGSQTT